MAAVELAQCVDPANCEIPHGLPWYFGVAVVAFWAVLVVGIVALGVWRWRLRAERRDRKRRRRRPSDSTDLDVARGN